MKKLIISLFLIPFFCYSQNTIHYPDDVLPTDSALLFAPGLINTGLFTRDFTMSPDRQEIYFSILSGRNAFIMVSNYKNEKWNEPEIASFSGSNQFFDFEPHISADGNKIYFLTTRPTEGQEIKPGWQNQNIFVVDRTKDGWSEPYDIGSPVNTINNEFYPSVSENNNLYFTHSTDAKDAALYVSEYQNGKYCEPQKLSFGNDSMLMLYNATVSRDESFILTCGSPKDNPGKSNYYVSFNLGNHNWSDLIDITNYIGYEGGAAASISLSPDGKYIFFSAIVADEKNTAVYAGMTLSEIKENRIKPQIGSSNVYWISSKFIRELQKMKL
jgi:hypothetical protein